MADRDPGRAEALGREPRPLGGWLILLAIILVLSPILIVLHINELYTVTFRSGLWEALDNPLNPFHDSSLKAALVFALLANVVALPVCVWMTVLFFLRRQRFIAWFTVVSVAMLIATIVDAVWAYAIVPASLGGVAGLVKVFLPHLVRVFVWVPYLKRSERAQQTFVR